MKFVFWGVGLLGALAVFFQGVQGYKRVLILRQTGMRENSMAVQNPPQTSGAKHRNPKSESTVWPQRPPSWTAKSSQNSWYIEGTQLKYIPKNSWVFFFQIGETFGPLWFGKFPAPPHMKKPWELLRCRYRVSFRSGFSRVFSGFPTWFLCCILSDVKTSFCVKDHFFFVVFFLFGFSEFFGGWHLDKSPVTFCLIGCNRKWKLGGISVSLKMWSWSRFFIGKVFNTPYFHRILVWFGVILGMKSGLMSFGTNLQHPVI